MTPLYAASKAGKTEAARTLLGRADIDVNKSTSALYDAFWTRAYKDLGIESVHLLTREGLESLWKTMPDRLWQSILEQVLFKGKAGMMGVDIDEKIRELLLSHALKAEGSPRKGKTALGAALDGGHLDIAGPDSIG